MRVLDLFSGTGSSTQAFTDRGHEVVTLDLDPDGIFDPTFRMDIKQFAKDPKYHLDRYQKNWRPHFVWMSPDCRAFSMAASTSEGWNYHGPFKFFGPRFPVTETSRIGCALVLAGYQIVKILRPRCWIRENPQGGMQTMAFSLSPHVERLTGYNDIHCATVTYCQYGDFRMKPTHLLGHFPEAWIPRPRCHNGDACHESAPRGVKAGTQSLRGSAERARVPYELGEEICIAMEKEMER